MKNVVFLDNLKESDIRSEDVYNKYKHLLLEDIQKIFPNNSMFITISCPGCSAKDSKFAFKKLGFNYHLCSKCGSLYVSPRPTAEMLRGFYKDSLAGRFFRNTYMKNTLESRSKKVFSLRVQWIMELAAKYLSNTTVLLDYATKYPTLLQEVANINIFKSILSLLPECFEQENLLPKNVKIIESNKAIKSKIDLFLAFEVIERVFEPMKLLKDAYGACRKNGLLLITSTTISGFEYQILGEYSPNIIPLDRINLLSMEALTGQIEMAGFEIIEASTPGRLDVEIVKNTYERNPDIPLHNFWKYVFCKRNESVLHLFQEFLQQSQLSSHVRIAAIKK
ncbi:class I SAM-dependent methyltransferase [bacterium]|nr:class I SAM-dependent methyltransferase [bacterium]